MRSYHLVLKSVVVVLCLGIVSSCARREESDTTLSSDTSITTTNSDQGRMIGDSASPGGSMGNTGSMASSMSDGNILSFMGMADSLEVTMGAMAKSKAKNAEVKKFAQTMVTEHTKMKKEGHAIAQRQSLTPVPPAGDVMGADMSSVISSLQGTSGVTFDSLYIASQIMAHERVLQNLNSVNPQDTALRSLVEKAKPHIQHHLDEARRIQGKLQTSASGTSGQ